MERDPFTTSNHLRSLVPPLVQRKLLLLAVPLMASAGCLATRNAPRAALPAEALVGAYELVSIGEQPVPAREYQAIYHAGRITLHPGRRYVSQIDAETCTRDNVCSRETATAEGTWLVLPDGTLTLIPREEDPDLREEDHPPAPRIVADGTEIRFYIPSVDFPIYTYRRR